jgi:2-dehydro-3-deoxyphosphogluconate aldolase/(4S)-4-hydroxy-2-oxoglutarate aldolase
MHPLLSQIGLIGIVPVIVIDDERNAEHLSGALMEAELPCAEVTFRTRAAPHALARMSAAHPAMLLGAGTVHTVEQARAALGAGAKFIVSPGMNRTLVEYCLAEKIPVVPGVATPTEVGAAMEMGLEAVKYFPAEALGGVDYLRAISAPYSHMQFIPTGGIHEKNLLAYLNVPAVLACGGSWMVKQELVAGGAWNEIRTQSSRAVHAVLGFELRHVGSTAPEAGDARTLLPSLGRLLGMQITDGDPSVSSWGAESGPPRKVSKGGKGDEKGHLAIGTNFIERAVSYLQRRGVGILPETRREENGRLAALELDLRIEGLTVLLVQR